MPDKLQIKKDGKLFETRWIYNKETEEGHYEDTDVTEDASRFLFEICDLESGIILKDIFLLLNSNLDIFDSIIGNWCKEIVTEGLTGQEKPYTGEYNQDEIEYLELYWAFDYDDGDYKDGESCFSGYHRPSFNGMGFEQKEDKLFESGEVECPKDKRTSWAVEMRPTNELINYPVKLGSKVEVYEENHTKKEYMSKLAEYNGATFTLGNILEGIIWELSFFGSPENRNKATEELHQRIEEYKEGNVELKSSEEVFENIKKKLNEKNEL